MDYGNPKEVEVKLLVASLERIYKKIKGELAFSKSKYSITFRKHEALALVTIVQNGMIPGVIELRNIATEIHKTIC
jgi:hypothetical protein